MRSDAAAGHQARSRVRQHTSTCVARCTKSTETIFIAFALVVLVVFAFLREWRTTLIPVLAIPVSIIGAFAVMAAAGFSINVLTLLGVVLAIGLVVDDAIVVLENIYAKIESGMTPLEAGIAGTREIFFAVISTTITLAVVFLPLLFMGGLSGRLFREFGVTIAGAVVHLGRGRADADADDERALPAVDTRSAGWLYRLTRAVLRRSGGEATPAASADALRYRWLRRGNAGGFRDAYRVAPAHIARVSLRRWRIAVGSGCERRRRKAWATSTCRSSWTSWPRQTAKRVPEAHMHADAGAGRRVADLGVQGAVNKGFVRLFLKDKSERDAVAGRDRRRSCRRWRASSGGARVNITQEASIGERRANQSGVQFVLQAADARTAAGGAARISR